MDHIPKKYSFIAGVDSHIPFEMALRYIRKVLFCMFLAIGTIETQVVALIAVNFTVFSYYFFFKPAKSRFTNWINILVELFYIVLEITIILYVNEYSPSTDVKLSYGKAMIALAICTLLFVVIWLVWQFVLFLYSFKCIRDMV